MLRYLRAAFTARPRVPGLGAVPFNLLGLTGFAILGLANPAFWFLGMGAEAAYLFGLASNAAFRAWVDGREAAEGVTPAPEMARSWEALIADLSADSRGRLSSLSRKRQQVLDLYAKSQVDDLTAAQNRESLTALVGHAARLLAAQENLERHWSDDAGADLRREAEDLGRELQGGQLGGELRASKTRTLEILQARIENLKKRGDLRAGIESELRRIEAQFDLALENAAMSSTPQAISSDLAIDLARFDQAMAGLGERDAAAGERQGGWRPVRVRRRERE